MPADPTALGTVQDVHGGTISVALAPATVAGLTFVEGHGYRIGQIGSFVRIPVGYVDLYGVVSQVGAGAVPERLAAVEPHGYRWMTVQLVGEGSRGSDFQRGVSQYPTVGDAVHLVTQDDLGRIYGRSDAPEFVAVGHLASAESIPALVDINRMVTRHCAVVGATGAGKSTTVAGLLASLSEQMRFPSSRIIVLDMHGEYGAALRDRANVFRVNPNTRRGDKPLFIPYWAMTYEELLSVTFGVLDDVSRGAVLERITELKLSAIEDTPRPGVTEDNLTVDTPVPFSIHKLWFHLHRLLNATHTKAGGQSEETEALLKDDNNQVVQPGDPMAVTPPKYQPHTQAAGETKIYLSSSPLNIRRQVEALASKLRDPRFDFLFRPGLWMPDAGGKPEKDIDALLDDWIGSECPITILDLSGIPPSVVTSLVGVLLRIVYDALFWSRNMSEGGRERPLLIVLEEAHSYLATGDTGPAATAVRRIVKEGRKYGIGAMIVSQRPSEIDSTILSQCGTIVAMRLANTTDRSHITAAVTDNLEGLLSMLPVLRTGEAIIVGEAVQLPVRTIIDPPSNDRRPDSSDPYVYDEHGPGGWNRIREPSKYSEVAESWRRQDHGFTAVREEVRERMERIPVTSSNIASVGYDAQTQTLEVEFTNGNIYQYFDVPQNVHEMLMDSDSKGSFLSNQIKGVYRYGRL